MKKSRKAEAPKKFSAAKFRFSKRKNLSKEDWDSSHNSEAVSKHRVCQSFKLLIGHATAYNKLQFVKNAFKSFPEFQCKQR